MAEIRLCNIKKTYEDNVTVLEGFELHIRDKEFIILVGPSGCGKSTTLRMIAGLEEITDGDLFIGDRRVNDVPAKDRDIAMVFQSYALYPHMSVYRNMSFALELKRVDRAEIDRRVREAARILDITSYLDRKPRALSGGQRQRVALGRAMVRSPSVFLLDEPLSNLDAKLRTEMRSQIKKLHERLQTTFVYVTHDQTEAMTMADRIVVMRDGKIQQIDTPENLYRFPINTFVAGFIGTPSMNLLRAVVEHEDARYFVRIGACRIPVPQNVDREGRLAACLTRTILFGIRPEHLSLSADGGGLAVRCELSEMMGAETFLYGQTDGGGIIARIPTGGRWDAGCVLHLAPNMEKAHFFDAESGVRIPLCDNEPSARA